MANVRKKESSPYPSASGYTIAPTNGWIHLGLREVWEYHDLIWSFAVRNLRTRYRQMALGPFWSILSPLIEMIIFGTIFGSIAKLPSDGIPYSIFAYTALIPWGYFSGVTTAASSSLVNEMDVISKIYFPRLVIPFSNVLSLLFDLLISLLILLGMILFYHFPFTWKLLIIPAYLLFAAIFGLGIGLWLATLEVRFRDVRNLTSYGLQVFKFITPVVYSAVLIPTQWQFLYRLNPMYWVIEGFRWMFLGTSQPPDLMIIVSVIITLLLFVSGMFVFRRTERTVVDWL